MKIEFVNHASFVIDNGTSRLICDPWMEGSIFDFGWRHLSKTQFKYEDFNNVTHIWFSHEHPDHFHPPSVKKIPEEARNKIKVLYQETVDEKVENYCKKLEFNEVIPLTANTNHKIDENLSIICNPWVYGDSYSMVEANGIKILNLNDCTFTTDEELKKIYDVTGPVDIVFLQFGYANKVGEEDEVDLRDQAIEKKISYFPMVEKMFSPKYMIPFASFVYFSHVENFYMNTNNYNIEKIFKKIEKQLNSTKAVLMYPGDIWEYDKNHDNAYAIERYQKDESKVHEPMDKSEGIARENLIENSQKFISRLKEKNPTIFKGFWKKSAKIYISDYQESFSLSYSNGLIPKSFAIKNYDLIVTSSALNYCFNFEWGVDTLSINGRYKVSKNGIYGRFKILGILASYNNKGEQLHIPNKSIATRTYQLVKHYYEIYFKKSV